jgi:GNAT superfamily N-acetyltransferase
MPLVVDRLRPDDLPAALRLSTRAGWNQIAADWQRLLDLSPQGCLAGRLDGALAATATVASYGRNAHWIGMVLVDEALRGRGLGSTMLTRAIEFAKSLGGGVIGLDATDLGRPVYLKQDFADVASIDRWSGVLQERGDSRGVAMLDRSTYDEAAALDRASHGADRSALLLHLMHEPGVFGILSPGAGFAFLRPGRTQLHVGPLVAADEESASRMLNRLAGLAQGSTVLLDAIRTPAGSALLESQGLSVARRLTRMTLGGPKKALMGELVRAATSFEWG